MKKRVFYLILGMSFGIVFASGCNLNKDTNLLGCWAYCDYDSTYIEACFKNDGTLLFYDLIVGKIQTNYKIVADSLIIFTDSFRSILRINYRNNQSVILVKDSLSLSLRRIEQDNDFWKSNSNKTEDENNFIVGFRQRSLNSCR